MTYMRVILRGDYSAVNVVVKINVLSADWCSTLFRQVRKIGKSDY